jgi:probable blue pigment (indigoidine) exporter
LKHDWFDCQNPMKMYAPIAKIDAPAALGFLWIAGVGTGLAYVCWFRGLRLMSAGSVSIIGLVNPAVGTLLGVAFAHEVFGPVQAVGMVLVLGGVLVGQRFGQRPIQRPSQRPSQRVVVPPATEATGPVLERQAA